jgi:hypothetical protein
MFQRQLWNQTIKKTYPYLYAITQQPVQGLSRTRRLDTGWKSVCDQNVLRPAFSIKYYRGFFSVVGKCWVPDRTPCCTAFLLCTSPTVIKFRAHGHHNTGMKMQLRHNNWPKCLLSPLHTQESPILAAFASSSPTFFLPSSCLYQKDQPALPASILRLEKFKCLI